MGRRLLCVVLAVTTAAMLAACPSEICLGDQDPNTPGCQQPDLSASPEPSRTPRPRPSPSVTTDPSPPGEPVKDDTTFVVRIRGGQCGIGRCGYKPDAFAVFVGTIVVVRNLDATTRAWTADDGSSFDSGPIEPGGEFRWKARKPGVYYFHDSYTNYIKGLMQVCRETDRGTDCGN